LLGWFSLIGLCSVWFSIKNNRYNQRHQYQRFLDLLSHFLLYLAIYVKEIYPIIKFTAGAAGDKGSIVTYFMSFEKGVIKELGNFISKYKKVLKYQNKFSFGNYYDTFINDFLFLKLNPSLAQLVRAFGCR